MAGFVKGDIVVVPFPFSDLTQTKRRPALILADKLRARKIDAAIAMSQQTRPVNGKTFVNQILEQFQLDPWTQSLVGVIQLEAETPTESYVDYLEEKYR
ncbi:hypothetical protein [Brunnivagina elsteri]|uniref:hypothetical protein n=1 Tax=Brunnivagina elsteri TaxID=1247191 RepID=UPI0011788431|nr:hypothetical protein [Calothrix elsteri]